MVAAITALLRHRAADSGPLGAGGVGSLGFADPVLMTSIGDATAQNDYSLLKL